MISGAAAFSAAAAAAASPEAIASSTLRTEVRMRERRPVLMSVRRAITRVALRAEDVLAIDLVSGCEPQRGQLSSAEKQGAAIARRRLGRLIKTCRWSVNAPETRLSGHFPRPRGVIAGVRRGLVRRSVRREWRRDPRPARIVMNVSQRGLHARHQRLAVEQLTDRHCTIECGGIARAPGALAEVRIEIGGR